VCFASFVVQVLPLNGLLKFVDESLFSASLRSEARNLLLAIH